MTKDFTCIICPNGCEIRAELQDNKIISITGNTCDKGADYVTQELTAPKRTVTSSVTVLNGELPLASVRTSGPVPKERIFDVMAEIRKVSLTAPVEAGTVVISDVLGCGCDVIVTKAVSRS
ncbi:MAG: DUF1667 domain-containing protein [Clostridiales bacterium]|nr:DUF1667 domain-containing protein [Candidatus Blautia equi]